MYDRRILAGVSAASGCCLFLCHLGSGLESQKERPGCPALSLLVIGLGVLEDGTVLWGKYGETSGNVTVGGKNGIV